MIPPGLWKREGGSRLGRFDGKVALLTGAASGIGRATAVRLASEGGSIFGVDINEQGLEETAKQITDAGGQMKFGFCDVTKRDECFAAVASTVTAFGKLDVLGNISGVTRFRHFHELTEEDWNLIIGVNLSGVAFMCQAAIPHLLETEGNIINIGSTASLMGQAYCVPYCASKGGVALLTRALAMEYVKKGIRVNAIAPGGVVTDMIIGVKFPEEVDTKLAQRYASFRGLCQPEEIAAVFAFLASDEARYVHGAIWTADGATTAG
jgi:NAD(P)-dependent dehydrogenase (short-subunit alcohol dehydrogenase family)